MTASRLPPAFFQGPTLDVAMRLLGMQLVRMVNGRQLIGRIVEVEAYHQNNDPASHSFCGKTPRNHVMFGPAGHLYVYLSYGVHYCMNVVTESEGVGAAVLIRAVEPLEGWETIRGFRQKAKTDRDLTNGPGKACQAFGIDLKDNGLSLQDDTLHFRLSPQPKESIMSSSRIGISKAVDLPWRFFLSNNAFVSKGKPSAQVVHKKTKKAVRI